MSHRQRGRGCRRPLRAPARRCPRDASWSLPRMSRAIRTLPAPTMAAVAEKKATSSGLKAVAKEMAAGQNETVQMLTGMLTRWGKASQAMRMPAITFSGTTPTSVYPESGRALEADASDAGLLVVRHRRPTRPRRFAASLSRALRPPPCTIRRRAYHGVLRRVLRAERGGCHVLLAARRASDRGQPGRGRSLRTCGTLRSRPHVTRAALLATVLTLGH